MNTRWATADDLAAINAWLVSEYEADPTFVCAPGPPYPSPALLAKLVTLDSFGIVYVTDDAGSPIGVSVVSKDSGALAWLRISRGNVSEVMPVIGSFIIAEGMEPTGVVQGSDFLDALLAAPGVVNDGFGALHWVSP